MKRLGLVLLLGCAAMTVARAADPAAADLFKQAQAASAAGKPDDAIRLYEQFITEHPGASNRWYEAQLNIAIALAKKGAWDDAVKAAHLCLDGAPTLQNFDSAVAVTAGIFSAQDKNVTRANEFLTFQQTGTGANPMDAVGYPALPEREKAFAALRQQAGDEDSSHLQAMTYLFTGKPKEALTQFADALRRSTNNTQAIRASSDLVVIGLRAVRGNRVGLDKALQFVVYGASGPDGKAGTADDLTDPFAAHLPAPPAAGQGGLAQYSADDLAALKQVREAAQLYWGDSMLGADIRQVALGSLLKSTKALDGWDDPARKDEFLKQALGDPADEQMRTLLIDCAEAAARGRQLNFGSVQALWAEINAKNISAKGVDDARKQFTNLCDALNKIPFPKIAPKPLTAPAKY